MTFNRMHDMNERNKRNDFRRVDQYGLRGQQNRTEAPALDDAPHSAQRRNILTGLGAAALLAACTSPSPSPSPSPSANTNPSARPDVATMRFDPSRRMGPTIWDQPSSRYRFEKLAFTSADGARRYRVWLAIPLGAAPKTGHPLICMTDGNAVADTLTSAELDAAARAGDAPVIVAIGPDSDLRFDVAARAYDYTPPVRKDGPTYEDEARGRLGGGGDRFLDLVEQHIIPAVTSRAAIDPQRRTMWGHSYGGLLSLHTLFRRPALFTRYAAADASLWWHDAFILGEARNALPLPTQYETMLLLMEGTGARPPRGKDEAQLDPATQRAHDERAAVPPGSGRLLAEQLAKRPHLKVLYRAFPNLTHGPMLPASIGPALAWAARRDV